jgi:hypothetical protein
MLHKQSLDGQSFAFELSTPDTSSPLSSSRTLFTLSLTDVRVNPFAYGTSSFFAVEGDAVSQS